MYASSAMLAISTEESQEAWQLATPICDESVALWELSLNVNTFWVGKKPLLSLLSTERSEEGSGGQQMTPEPLNEAFSVKDTQIKS